MTRIVIVGGVGGGATAAARLARLSGAASVTVVERSRDVAFANCGLPYYIGRTIEDRHKLSLHTAASLKHTVGVTDVRVFTEAVRINRGDKTVSVRDVRAAGSAAEPLPYDKLILSPGAAPFVPPLPGVTDARVMTLRNLEDMDRIDAAVHAPGCGRVTVVGAGFIGLEMVEQLVKLGKTVTLVERAGAVLPQADAEMAGFLHPALHANGVELVVGDGLRRFDPQPGHVGIELDSGRTVVADAVILCIGVKADAQLARDAGLALTAGGRIDVNDFMQTSDASIYAVGDAVETKDMVFPERRAWVALGNIANMQARIAADHAVGQRTYPYHGSLGTSIVRAFDRVLALTGWTETRLARAGIPHLTTTVTGPSHASYYPGHQPVTLKLTFDPDTGRIFGATAIGTVGVERRIDVVATAIQGRLTVDDISQTQLAYAPPFGSARDTVNVAGLAARNRRDGLVKTTAGLGAGRTLLDVRVACDQAADPLDKSIPHVPFSDVADAIAAGTLDKNKKYTTLCNWGKTAYFAARTMEQAGFDVEKIEGGRRMQLIRDDADKPASHL
jgi:NADPH-dependent 2,4-dienoyl-CoA reductase/sulfur reductase-like enzyme/rhodanese-related sulfurtransferase